MLIPPKSVQGPYEPPALPPGLPTQSQPRVRYHQVSPGQTLSSIAQAYFGNPLRAVDIFNANIVGQIRSDRTDGFLYTMSDPLSAGTTLVIP